jgi:hypothetical protein
VSKGLSTGRQHRKAHQQIITNLSGVLSVFLFGLAGLHTAVTLAAPRGSEEGILQTLNFPIPHISDVLKSPVDGRVGL